MSGKTNEFAVDGFAAAAVAAGLKKDGKPDLALIVSHEPAAAAGVFTLNRVKAAPVLLSQAHIGGRIARAILVNAGNANACTGRAGMEGARATAREVSERLGVPLPQVLLASTGVIGQPFPYERVCAAVPSLVEALGPQKLPEVAQAIMTTDSFPKLSTHAGEAGGRSYRIVGLAKGAGMIMPHMATMLSFVLTDASIEPDSLCRMLGRAVERTFNRVTVDGDTSTNDTVFLLANGRAGNRDFSRGDLEASSAASPRSWETSHG